jgi:hypothetical protein
VQAPHLGKHPRHAQVRLRWRRRRRPAISITMHACRRMGVRVLLVPSLPWSPPDKKTPARRNRASC